MNDTESNIFGWKMRLLEIEGLIYLLEEKKKQYLAHIEFWTNEQKGEKA